MADIQLTTTTSEQLKRSEPAAHELTLPARSHSINRYQSEWQTLFTKGASPEQMNTFLRCSDSARDEFVRQLVHESDRLFEDRTILARGILTLPLLMDLPGFDAPALLERQFYFRKATLSNDDLVTQALHLSAEAMLLGGTREQSVKIANACFRWFLSNDSFGSEDLSNADKWINLLGMHESGTNAEGAVPELWDRAVIKKQLSGYDHIIKLIDVQLSRGINPEVSRKALESFHSRLEEISAPPSLVPTPRIHIISLLCSGGLAGTLLYGVNGNFLLGAGLGLGINLLQQVWLRAINKAPLRMPILDNSGDFAVRELSDKCRALLSRGSVGTVQ